MTSKEVEIGLADIGNIFDYRKGIVVPNVSYGFGLDYEADLVHINASNYMTEIEIKVSKQDYLNDKLKAKWKKGLDKKVRYFYYAVPTELIATVMADLDPNHGLIEVYVHRNRFRSKIIKKALKIGSTKLTQDDIINLTRLSVMRFWKQRLGRYKG
jgi:hypothetical protein